MHIRPATAEDADSIAAIQVAAWRAAYVQLMPDAFLAHLSVLERAAMWRKALSESSPGATMVTLNSALAPVGFCVYGPSRDDYGQGGNIGELVALNVLPSEWRRGYGHALCDAALVHARQVHWCALTLWVLHGNRSARTFYERHGFEADAAEKHTTKLTGCVLHEVRYRKVLAANAD